MRELLAKYLPGSWYYMSTKPSATSLAVLDTYYKSLLGVTIGRITISRSVNKNPKMVIGNGELWKK